MKQIRKQLAALLLAVALAAACAAPAFAAATAASIELTRKGSITVTLRDSESGSAVSGGRLTISAQTTMLDLPACLTLCCVAVLPPLLKGKFYRWQGLLMLVIYAAYMVMLALA